MSLLFERSQSIFPSERRPESPTAPSTTREVREIATSHGDRQTILWIDWGRHLRTETLSRRLGVPVEQICEDGGRLGRYVRSAYRTVATVRRKPPEVVIATNPSIVLGFLLLVLRRWYGFKLVSDAHYYGVRAVKYAWFLQRLIDFHNSQADVVIVTNENHARFVSSLGSRAYVCPDPLPSIPTASRPTVQPGDRSVFLICSFSPDEPYEAAFEAFSSLQKDGFTLYVSGNYRKAKTDLSRFPWVRLLGFVPAQEYYDYLRSASVVMDLTTSDDCLVCGGYEALVAEKPLIVSDTAALAEYFGDAAVLTENTATASRERGLAAFAQREELVQRARRWVTRNRAYMDERIAGLRTLLLGPVRND